MVHRSGKATGQVARYTGRSLYPGLRTQERNQRRLRSLNFYRDLERDAQTNPESSALVNELRARGRWPAKPSDEDCENGMTAWLGSGKRWLDADGEFQRAIERPQDPELLLRHEVQDNPPDLLITNYSMLEYMLLRPIERPIFEETRAFFERHTNERLLFVLDEAHLYRGASGTEVALLIRRLRNRLGLSPDRLQVIATGASFSNGAAAQRFIGGLVGRDVEMIEVLRGTKYAREPSGPGDNALVDALAACRLRAWLTTRAASVEAALRDVIPDVAVRGKSDSFFAELPQALLNALERVGAANDDTPLALADAEIVAEEGPTLDFGIADYGAESDLFGSPATESLAERHDAAEVNPDAPQKPQNLLDRLFATAVLPRYAFPTDVVTFTVFDPSSTPYRAEIAYSPQAGLTQALSQYAPGREVWVDGRKFRSMAIYSPFQKDRVNAYRAHKLYYECGRCGYAKLEDHDDKHHRGQTEDCPACKKKAGMGPAERWVVPVGFAHPYDEPVELPGEELPLPNSPDAREAERAAV